MLMGCHCKGWAGSRHELTPRCRPDMRQGAIYRVDGLGEPALFRRIATTGFSPDDFETKQVFVPSKDGTKVRRGPPGAAIMHAGLGHSAAPQPRPHLTMLGRGPHAATANQQQTLVHKSGILEELTEAADAAALAPLGLQVPMFIVHRKGLQLDGSNPTLLYGYGARGL